jgi:16S rRNA (adenine1518-N6/adenine1519-N6)-dimethyltransferase
LYNLTNIGVIKALTAKHGFDFSKKLGQNFLINPSVCPKIAEYGNATDGWGILEIGAGIGVLTAELAKNATKVVTVEVDSKLLPILSDTLSDFQNITIINQDFMKTDIKSIIEEEFTSKGLKVAVCANLPYYITTPVIMKLLEDNLPINSIAVMVQKEMAQRICAKIPSRESSAITVAVNYYADAETPENRPVERLFDVSRGSFYPSPNVDSSVIRITLQNHGNNIHKLPPAEEKKFFQIVRGAFSQRRKTLVNSVSSITDFDKEIITEKLQQLGISPDIRAEKMSLKNFLDLSCLL